MAGLPTLKVFGRAKAQAASHRRDLRALPALDEVSLNVQAGEVVALAGRAAVASRRW